MAKSTKSATKIARKRKAPLRGTRSDSKQAKLIEMLKRPDGATINQSPKSSNGSSTQCGAPSPES